MYSPSLTNEEERFRTSRSMHRAAVHGRELQVLWGLDICLIGASMNWILSSPNFDAAYWTLQVPSTLLFIGWLFFPCKCGREPVLTRQLRYRTLCRRKHIESLGSFKILYGLLCFVAGFAMFTLYLAGPVIVGMYLWYFIVGAFFGSQMCKATLGLPCLAVGAFIIIRALRSAKQNENFLTQEEIDKISQCDPSNIKDLNELISFNLRIGNLEKSDEYSRRLLVVCEGKAPCAEMRLGSEST